MSTITDFENTVKRERIIKINEKENKKKKKSKEKQRLHLKRRREWLKKQHVR